MFNICQFVYCVQVIQALACPNLFYSFKTYTVHFFSFIFFFSSRQSLINRTHSSFHQAIISPPGCLKQLWRKKTNNHRTSSKMTWKPSLPMLPATQNKTLLPASSIPPGQKTPVSLVVPVSWATKKTTPEDYGKDRVSKYAPYFKENAILPIPELVVETKSKTLFFIITDLRTWRLAELKNKTFGELLKTAGIPSRYFCQQNFITWDVLLPSVELVAKLAGSNMSTMFFQLQPEYQGKSV